MSEWSGRKLHFIAIGGAGMSGLALVARALGAGVTGSDRADSSYMERLRRAGLEPQLGHDAENVPDDAEVVVSTAIGADNPELSQARERGQRVIHRGELLAEVCALRRLIAVAGTHGKTTTASMLVHALRGLGADPSFLLGGELPEAGPEGEATNAHWGEGKWIVAEADESDASFLRLEPEVAVITNVELDHHSRWASLRALTDAFSSFLAQAEAVALPATEPPFGLLHSGTKRVARFGLLGDGYENGELVLAATALVYEGGRSVFRLRGTGVDVEASLGVPGAHNVLNALAALAGVGLMGEDLAAAVAALADFPGVARRLESKGTRGGARIYDDYAHHPTEVSATLEAARDLTDGRLVAVFQPHLYSRTKALAREFGAALSLADEIGVLEVYPAREEPLGELAGVTGRAVAEAAADHAGGRPVWWLVDVDRAARALGPRLREGDLLVTLGAGDVYRLAERLIENGGEEE